MFEYNLYQLFFYYFWQNTYIKRFFITIIIKWCFCWCCLMMRVLLSFLLQSPLCVRVNLSTDTNPATSCFAQLLQYSQNILKVLAFKYFVNNVLLETERTKVMLIWRLVSIECITSFSKFSFWYLFSNDSLLISTSLGKPFSIYRYHDHRRELLKLKFRSFTLNFKGQVY